MSSLVILWALFVTPAPVELVAVTFSGDEYVLGSGDDCAAAWEDHGPFPEDWRVIECR